jgi:hypothetical protein
MAILIYILFFATIFHFVYESILLPSWRLELRYKLFALRDEARQLKFKYTAELSDDVFLHVQHSINTSISLLPHMTPSLIADAKREFDTNPHLQRVIEKRTELLDSCKIQEVRDVMDKAAKYSLTALTLNIGGWFLYLSPIFLIVIPIMFFVGAFKKLKKLILSLTVVSDHEVSKLIPQSEYVLV